MVDLVEEAASGDQDRVRARVDADGIVLALADGAGGTSGGREAAEFIVSESLASSGDARSLLTRLDRELGQRGESTGVVARLTPDRVVVGASVGDSEAWALRGGEWRELTAGQSRKPLLGSGRATPAGFMEGDVERLLIASDGLVKYAAWATITALLSEDGPELLWQLADAARLPSGALPDDLSLILVSYSYH